MIRMSPVADRLALTLGSGIKLVVTCGFEIG